MTHPLSMSVTDAGWLFPGREQTLEDARSAQVGRPEVDASIFRRRKLGTIEDGLVDGSRTLVDGCTQALPEQVAGRALVFNLLEGVFVHDSVGQHVQHHDQSEHR